MNSETLCSQNARNVSKIPNIVSKITRNILGTKSKYVFKINENLFKFDENTFKPNIFTLVQGYRQT